MPKLYLPQKAVVQKVIEETPTIKTFVLETPGGFSFNTGEFVELTFPGKGEAPFTPSSDPAQRGNVEVTIMSVGRVTNLFHQAQAGTTWGIRGPYGRGYPVSDFQDKEIVIVGGGVGLAPLRSLIYSLFASIDKYKKIVICYGARTPEDIVYKRQIEEWRTQKGAEVRLSVDKGDSQWKGKVGVVTILLEDLPVKPKDAIAVVCGPPIMMKFSTLKLLELGFNPSSIYLSMEKNMSCGLGKCGHCRLGRFYACKDGPVFTFEEIKEIEDIWD